MSDSRTKFYLDPQNGKWKGVCAGIADYVGIEVLWVRLAVAGLMIVGQQWWILLAYFVMAWIVEPKPSALYHDRADQKFWQGVRANPTRSTTEVRAKFRDLDRRLADIELHYTSRNSSLANEIESLR